MNKKYRQVIWGLLFLTAVPSFGSNEKPRISIPAISCEAFLSAIQFPEGERAMSPSPEELFREWEVVLKSLDEVKNVDRGAFRTQILLMKKKLREGADPIHAIILTQKTDIAGRRG